MSLHALLSRGTNTGAITSYSVASAQNNENHKPVSKAGMIAGIVAGVVLLIIIAVFVDRQRRRKTRQGERMVGVVGEEETMPLGAGQLMGESQVGGGFPRPLILGQGNRKGKEREMPISIPIAHPGEQYDIGEYAGGGYADAVDEAEVGRQGTQYYQNQ